MKRKISGSLLALLALSFYLVGCYAQPESAPVSLESSDQSLGTQSELLSTSGALRLSDMKEMKLYENAEHGFKMSYPSNWVAQEPDANDLGIVVGFLAPEEDVNNPAVYIYLQVENLPVGQKITLEQYSQAVLSSLNNSMPGLKIITENDIFIDDLPGHAVVYDLVSEGTTYRVLKAWTIRGEKAFAFTYNAPLDRYDAIAGYASKIIGSLKAA
jgi:hypothetical protein